MMLLMNHIVIAMVLAMLCCSGCCAAGQDKVAGETPKAKVADISGLLEPIRQKHNVPAICAAVEQRRHYRHGCGGLSPQGRYQLCYPK